MNKQKNETITKIAQFVYKFVSKPTVIPLCMAALGTLVMYTGVRVINLLFDRAYLNMTTPIDAAIPVIPAFVIIYVLAFPFWVVSDIMISRQSEEKCYRLTTALLLGKFMCGVIFLIIPTTNVRPEIETTGLSTWLLNLIYTLDMPNNLFPSMHCLESWICFAAIRDEKAAPKWMKLCSFIFAILICVSTLYTKQHVIADVLGGIGIAELFWQLAPAFRFNKMYANLNEIIKLP